MISSQDFKNLKAKAEGGDINAQMAVAHYEGNGVSQDFEKAMYWYDKVDIQGDLDTQNNQVAELVDADSQEMINIEVNGYYKNKLRCNINLPEKLIENIIYTIINNKKEYKLNNHPKVSIDRVNGIIITLKDFTSFKSGNNYQELSFGLLISGSQDNIKYKVTHKSDNFKSFIKKELDNIWANLLLSIISLNLATNYKAGKLGVDSLFGINELLYEKLIKTYELNKLNKIIDEKITDINSKGAIILDYNILSKTEPINITDIDFGDKYLIIENTINCNLKANLNIGKFF